MDTTTTTATDDTEIPTIVDGMDGIAGVEPLTSDADAAAVIAADVAVIGRAFDEITAIASGLRVQVGELNARQPAGVNLVALNALADRLDSAAQSYAASSTPAAAIPGTSAGYSGTVTEQGVPAQVGGASTAAQVTSTEDPAVVTPAPGSVMIPGTAATVSGSTDVTADAEQSVPTPIDVPETPAAAPAAETVVTDVDVQTPADTEVNSVKADQGRHEASDAAPAVDDETTSAIVAPVVPPVAPSA